MKPGKHGGSNDPSDDDAPSLEQRHAAATRVYAQEAAPPPDDGPLAGNVVAMRSLYQQHAGAAPVLDETGGSEWAHRNRRRRIVHFEGRHKIRFGRVRWRQVVAIKPGRKNWVAVTIDPKTGEFDAWVTSSPELDPAKQLGEQGETVISTSFQERNGWSWLTFWRWFYGYRIRTDVDLAKFITGYDIPRARKPHQLYRWMMGEQPEGKQRSKSKAVFAGLRGFIADMMAWL